MIKGLKVVLIIFGAIEVLMGLGMVIVPAQMASMAGVSDPSGYLIYTLVSLGICLLVPSVFLILAARDPLRHIKWVQFAIAWCILGALAGLYAVIQGAVNFGEAGMQIIMDAVFAVVFLALYPYRAARRAK